MVQGRKRNWWEIERERRPPCCEEREEEYGGDANGVWSGARRMGA